MQVYCLPKPSREKAKFDIARSLIDPVFPRPIGINDDFFNPKEAIANGNDQQRPKDQGKPKYPNGLAIDRYDDFIWYFQVISFP